MKSQALQYFPMLSLSCIALVLFTSVYLAVFFKAYGKQNKKIYKELSRLPLNEDIL